MEILTARELADILKVSLPTLYKLANQGEIPGFRLANEWRFEKKVIDKWIESLQRQMVEGGELSPRAGGVVQALGKDRASE